MCLSLWQPWASLVVSGLMRFESRMWDSSHRGPLWIHAGGNPPTKETIAEVEAQFSSFYKGKVPLPDRYPLGSIIGQVDLQTILTQEEYLSQVPETYREIPLSGSYILVFRNPRKIRLPIK